MWMEKTFIAEYDQTTKPQPLNHCFKDTHDNTEIFPRKSQNNQLCDLLKCLEILPRTRIDNEASSKTSNWSEIESTRYYHAAMDGA